MNTQNQTTINELEAVLLHGGGLAAHVELLIPASVELMARTGGELMCDADLSVAAAAAVNRATAEMLPNIIRAAIVALREEGRAALRARQAELMAELERVNAELGIALPGADVVPSPVPAAKDQAAPAESAPRRVAPKYRNPETGETWSDRGLQPKWVAKALAEGKTLDELSCEAQERAAQQTAPKDVPPAPAAAPALAPWPSLSMAPAEPPTAELPPAEESPPPRAFFEDEVREITEGQWADAEAALPEAAPAVEAPPSRPTGDMI